MLETDSFDPLGAQGATGTSPANPKRNIASYALGSGLFATAKLVTAGEWVWITEPTLSRAR